MLQNRVIELLGRARFREAATNMFVDQPIEDLDSIEVGPLRLLVDARIGGTNPKLRSAARRLHDARNKLAHISPLRYAELQELVTACDQMT